MLHSNFWPRSHQTFNFASTGVCAYITGFVLPLKLDIPLIVLGLMSVLAIASHSREISTSWSLLALAVLGFVVAIGLSTFLSADIGRSLRVSMPFLPGILLFFLIAEHLEDIRDIRFLYLTFSIVGLGLAVALLWFGWQNGWRITNAMVPRVGSPILIVRNDSTFLALIAPLSFALSYREPRGVVGGLAALSILVSIAAVVFMHSRTAMLTMIISLMCAGVLMQPRYRLAFSLVCCLVVLAFALLIDGLLGFPLGAKFVNKWTLSGRTGYWATAWAMFRDTPLLGQGPHTFGLFHKTPWPHNLYLEVLAERGLVGLASLVFLLASGLKVAWKARRALFNDTGTFSAGVLAELLGFCGAAVVELSFVRQWAVVILFTLLGAITQLSLSQTRHGVQTNGYYI